MPLRSDSAKIKFPPSVNRELRVTVPALLRVRLKAQGEVRLKARGRYASYRRWALTRAVGVAALGDTRTFIAFFFFSTFFIDVIILY